MEITRQHETTNITELNGSTCTKLQGVGPGNEAGFHAWYLEANDTWYRFFVQHGILFWDTSAPDPEDDLADDENYYDAFEQLGLVDSPEIETVEMSNGCLTITLATGPKILFKETEESGGMSIDVT